MCQITALIWKFNVKRLLIYLHFECQTAFTVHSVSLCKISTGLLTMDSRVAEHARETSAAQSLFLYPYWALYEGMTTSSDTSLKVDIPKHYRAASWISINEESCPKDKLHCMYKAILL